MILTLIDWSSGQLGTKLFQRVYLAKTKCSPEGNHHQQLLHQQGQVVQTLEEARVKNSNSSKILSKTLASKSRHLSTTVTLLSASVTLLVRRQLYTGASSHCLSAMLYEVGLPVRESHDAMDDADDCRRICRRMAAQCGYRFLNFIVDPNWYHDVTNSGIGHICQKHHRSEMNL